ncbi:MAG TPA: hypothetical protein VHM28_01925 [Anaerolineales bacterium]|jgi:hypothetical protein|nr:hypothetical protein [Anaerolineales bacterium]
MPTIETVVRQINRELVPQFEEKLRIHLAAQDKEWLVEQVIRLTLDAHSLQEKDRKRFREEEDRKRSERARRVRALGLDRDQLKKFVNKYKHHDRKRLARDGYLKKSAPAKGGDLITGRFRYPKGNTLLNFAKDMLFGLLFGEEGNNTYFERIQRELLTLTLPRAKSDALDFMKATTELSALGTWQDPKGAANDLQADNVVLEIEYGEIEGELIGDGIILALSLINNLEINEEILYGRMENIEQSTLIT